jgi:hypothetical protein
VADNADIDDPAWSSWLANLCWPDEQTEFDEFYRTTLDWLDQAPSPGPGSKDDSDKLSEEFADFIGEMDDIYTPITPLQQIGMGVAAIGAIGVVSMDITLMIGGALLACGGAAYLVERAAHTRRNEKMRKTIRRRLRDLRRKRLR